MEVGHFDLQKLDFFHAGPLSFLQLGSEPVNQTLEFVPFDVCSFLHLLHVVVEPLDLLALLDTERDQLLLFASQGVLLVPEQILQVLFFEVGQLGDSFLLSDDFVLGGFGQTLDFFQKVLFFLLDRGQFVVDLLVLPSGLLCLLFDLHVFVCQILL